MASSTDPNTPEFNQDSRKLAFLDFLATPKHLRGRGQKEFAVEIQVAPQTLSEWKKDKLLMNAVIERVKEYSREQTPDIIDGLTEKAKRGDTAATKLWLQYVMNWSEKSRHEVTNKPVPILSFLRDALNKES